MNKLFEEELITNEFLIIIAILLCCVVLIIWKGSLSKEFVGIASMILGFVSRGALNNHIKKQLPPEGIVIRGNVNND